MTTANPTFNPAPSTTAPGPQPPVAAGVAAIAAGLLILASTASAGSTAVGEPGANGTRFAASNVCLLMAYGVMLLAIAGISRYQRDEAGLLGRTGAGAAAAGTLLAFGATWANLFVSPWLVDVAPTAAAGQEATGSLRLGFLLTYGIFAAGWALLAIASIRAGVLSRFTSVLLLPLSILSFFPSRIDPENTVKLPTELHHPVPLAVIIAIIGVQILRRRPSEPSPRDLQQP